MTDGALKDEPEYIYGNDRLTPEQQAAELDRLMQLLESPGEESV